MNILKAFVLALFAAVSCGSLSGCAAPHANGGWLYGGGMTPLYEASYRGDLQTAKQLLDNGAQVDAQSPYNMTPLTVAIWKGHTEMVRLLVNRGANVNLVNSSYRTTPIMDCGQYGNAKIAQILIDAGADLSVHDKDGKTVASIAIDYKKLDVVGVLRRAGAAVSYTGKKDKDIVIAAISGDKEKVLALLAAGVDSNIKIENDRHLLMYAVDWKWPEVVTQLLNKGANTDDRDSDGWTAMMHAAFDNQTETLKAFELAGVKMPYKGDLKGDLLIAVLAGDRVKVASMLAQKTDVNSRYRYNSTLLNYAAYKRDLTLSTLLLDNKADSNLANDSGVSPFSIALMNKDLDLVKIMLSRGADVNSKNPSGFTALMFAIAYTDVATVKELLSRGAQPDANAVILSQGGYASLKKVNLPEITALLKPEVLRRQMLRAQAAVEAAQSPADFQSAVQEYELAKLVAPESAEIYYNLGLVQDKAGLYNDAIRNLNQYLRLSPASSDAQAVKDMVYKLEYKRDQSSQPR